MIKTVLENVIENEFLHNFKGVSINAVNDIIEIYQENNDIPSLNSIIHYLMEIEFNSFMEEQNKSIVEVIGENGLEFSHFNNNVFDCMSDINDIDSSYWFDEGYFHIKLEFTFKDFIILQHYGLLSGLNELFKMMHDNLIIIVNGRLLNEII